MIFAHLCHQRKIRTIPDSKAYLKLYVPVSSPKLDAEIMKKSSDMNCGTSNCINRPSPRTDVEPVYLENSGPCSARQYELHLWEAIVAVPLAYPPDAVGRYFGWIKSFHIISYHVMSYHVMSCHDSAQACPVFFWIWPLLYLLRFQKPYVQAKHGADHFWMMSANDPERLIEKHAPELAEEIRTMLPGRKKATSKIMNLLVSWHAMIIAKISNYVQDAYMLM